MRFVSGIILLLAISFARGDFTNIEVSQTIHADSHIVRVEVEITIDLPSDGPSAYKYPIDTDVYQHLAFIEAKASLIFMFFNYYL